MPYLHYNFKENSSKQLHFSHFVIIHSHININRWLKCFSFDWVMYESERKRMCTYLHVHVSMCEPNPVEYLYICSFVLMKQLKNSIHFH
jgi:hypothetical protein